MQSIRAQYNDEVIQAHREAIATLRELLAETTDPLERRRLAVALLKARPVKTAELEQDAKPETEPSPAAAHRSSTLAAVDTGAPPQPAGIAPHPAFSPRHVRPLGAHTPAAAETPAPPDRS